MLGTERSSRISTPGRKRRRGECEVLRRKRGRAEGRANQDNRRMGLLRLSQPMKEEAAADGKLGYGTTEGKYAGSPRLETEKIDFHAGGGR